MTQLIASYELAIGCESTATSSSMPFEYGEKHSDGSLVCPLWYELYDAIAAGKIPHIRID